MTKKLRDKVKDKFGGLCAYTGKSLDKDWQVDHMYPLSGHKDIDKNGFDNLMPTIKIINHYKRSHTLESFRRSMASLHLRLAKLPKKTNRPQTIRRKEYLLKVADLFDITIDKPFSGIFYFETLA